MPRFGQFALEAKQALRSSVGALRLLSGSVAVGLVLCASVGTTSAEAVKGRCAKWGALAANGKGNWGYGLGYASVVEARQAALRGCANSECKIVIAGCSSCVAYYELREAGGYWYGLSLDSSLERVRQVARGGCMKGAPHRDRLRCHEVKALCN